MFSPVNFDRKKYELKAQSAIDNPALFSFALLGLCWGEGIMRRRVIRGLSSLAALFLLCACTAQALQQSTIDQGSTVSDLLEQMVLDNLEMIRQEPGALPWHLKVTQGTTTLQDQANVPQYSYTWPTIANTIGGNSLGQRQWQLGWTVVPVIDGSVLLSLQQRYKMVASSRSFESDFVEGAAPPSGGPFGHYGTVFIWPRPGHRQALTRLVTDVLNSAPVTASERTFAIPGPKSFK